MISTMKKYLTTRKSGLYTVEEKLEDYNIEPKLIPIDLSRFKGAIMHVRRIHKFCYQVRSVFAHPLSCIHSWNGIMKNFFELVGCVDLTFIYYFPPGSFQH